MNFIRYQTVDAANVHTELDFQFNHIFGGICPPTQHFFEAAAPLQCAVHIKCKTVAQKAEYIKQGGFARAICTNHHAEIGNINHFGVTITFKIF